MIKTHQLFAIAALTGIIGGQAFYAASPGLAADGNGTTTAGNKTSCSSKDGCKAKKDADKNSCSSKNGCKGNKTSS